MVQPAEYLCGLEQILLQEYYLTLDQEEQFWKQKSREQWLGQGDQKSRYFFLSTITRRRRNKLEGLFDNNAQWRTDQLGLCDIAVHYFQSLYKAAPGTAHINFHQLKSGGLLPSELTQLHQLPSLADIKAAVFGIGATKSPGIDGIPAHFFQIFWSLTAQDVARTI